jgi:hypothetical protein
VHLARADDTEVVFTRPPRILGTFQLHTFDGIGQNTDQLAWRIGQLIESGRDLFRAFRAVQVLMG